MIVDRTNIPARIVTYFLAGRPGRPLLGLLADDGVAVTVSVGDVELSSTRKSRSVRLRFDARDDCVAADSDGDGDADTSAIADGDSARELSAVVMAVDAADAAAASASAVA